MSHQKLLLLSTLLTITSLLLGACSPTVPPVSSITPSPTATAELPTPTLVVETPAPTPTPTPKTLIICQQQEPDTLYWYGGAQQGARNIQQAIYDGPLDNRTYDIQPVILEKIPSLKDGDAEITTVIVQAGDKVMDNRDNPVVLTEGVFVHPAGCRGAECVVEFTGEPLEMDQWVVTFRLREGVTWSDGEPVTAADSVYSFELAGAPDTPVSKYLYERTANYEAVDERTTVWTGLPGYNDSLYASNFWLPLPRHLWETRLGYAAAELLQAEESSRMPLGWGPFVIKEWVAGDHITLEKNPRYFRADEGLPYVDRVLFRFVDNPDAAVAQLLSGECDIVASDMGLDEQVHLLLALEEQGLLQTLFTTSPRWEQVSFGIQPVAGYKRPDFFGDVRMRQALAYCLDREGVADTLFYGQSPVLNSYLPPEHPLYAGQRLAAYPYDPEKGAALLEELGWQDKDGDGVREARGVEGIREGTLLEFDWLSTATPSYRLQYIQTFQQNLADCGVKVNLKTLPLTEYFAQGPAGPLFGRQFDLGSFAWLTDVEKFCQPYCSSEVPREENGWVGENISGFSNEEYDAACARALEALPGSEDYIIGYKESQRIFSEQLPVIPLFLQLRVAISRPEVVGVIMDPTEVTETWNIELFDVQR